MVSYLLIWANAKNLIAKGHALRKKAPIWDLFFVVYGPLAIRFLALAGTWRGWAILFVLIITLQNKRIYIVLWINPYTAYPTKLKKNCIPYPTTVEILNNKNNFAIYPSKKTFCCHIQYEKKLPNGTFFSWYMVLWQWWF